MVRKSERNKASAEKVEKPSSSRKSTRSSRRRKKSTSESEPEAEAPEETTPNEASSLPTLLLVPEEIPEVPDQKESKSRRGRPRRQAPSEDTPAVPEASEGKKEEWNEDEKFWGETSKAMPSETPKMDDENSTWKIQSSNGSGGEIQKLKICRQRLTDSAESSSSPAKEVSSPRRKRYRKRKERLLEGDGTESAGSHSDSEVPTSTVVDTVPNPTKGDLCDVDSSTHHEIPPRQEELVTQEADSASVSQDQENDTFEGDETSPAEAETRQLPESVGGNEMETAVVDGEQETVELTERHDLEVTGVSPKRTEQTIGSPSVGVSDAVGDTASDEVTEVGEDHLVVEHVHLVGESQPEQREPESEPEPNQCVSVSEPEPDQSVSVTVPEPDQPLPVYESEPEQPPEHVTTVTIEPRVPEPSKSDAVESKPPRKTHKKNLKLAVSHEDAVQQIAMKLNERAARFSKEATEEAAKRSAPVKPPREKVVEEEEEGEISRDPTSTKTLELKRLHDDGVEPKNKKHERCRRPIIGTPSTPAGTPIELGTDSLEYDVSTEILKALFPDMVLPLGEEEVKAIFDSTEDDLGTHQINSDDGGSTGDIGEVEEEGELIEEDSEDKKKKSSEDRHDKHSKGHRPSREEGKKPERRVTKETSKKGSRGDRKDSRSSIEEPRTKKYERDESKKEGPRRSGEQVDKSEAPRNEENHKTVRKITIVPDDAKSITRSVSPSSKKPSPVLFITNLVRPFTIAQLRELLARTGTITPNGFYIDKIKSKCFVKYNDVEMAIETRHALHGVKWPMTNPRTLRVEFSTDEAMEAVKKMAEEEDAAAKRQDLAAQNLDKSWYSEKDVLKPPKRPKNLVREWDMGKDVGEVVPVHEGIKKGKEEEWGVKAIDKRVEKEEIVRRRHISPSQENLEPARKVKRRENEAPARLLDDLFRKTKATPCIYWLPLTAAQIAVKEEMRRQHMAEHQKRLSEMRKTDSSRRDKDKSRDRDRERERARDRRRK